MKRSFLIGFSFISFVLVSCGQRQESNSIKSSDDVYNSIQSDDSKDSYSTLIGLEQYTLGKTYSTRYYSIGYPADWQCSENINEMTDVYIGSNKEPFGFTIVRFETDYSLFDANKEGNENLRRAGYKILDEKQIIVDGVKCYRANHEITLQGQRIIQISFTFKKGDMLYNIKFGSIISKSHETIATKIIESFRFK